MSRVVAFSCVHLAGPETQQALFDVPVDYTPARRLMARLLADPPDVVVNLGDFSEPWYEEASTVETALLPEYAALEAIARVVRLRGNHDRSGAWDATIDDVLYAHGHLNLHPASTEMLRKAHSGRRMVHGHTHEAAGPWPLDVGSLTFGGTYGEIVDGVPALRVA